MRPSACCSLIRMTWFFFLYLPPPLSIIMDATSVKPSPLQEVDAVIPTLALSALVPLHPTPIVAACLVSFTRKRHVSCIAS